MRRSLIVVSCLSSTLLGVAAAAEPAADETLLVTADRQSTSASRTTASVAVVDADDRRDQGYQPTLGSALRGQVGLDMIGSGGPLNSGRGIQMRGTGTADTRVLIDGIPAGDPASPNNAADFNTIDPTGLAQVEIVRGPQSSLYGSGAVGGVINVLTIRPTATPRIGLRLEGGSFATASGEATATGPLSQTVGYAVAVGGLTTNGFTTLTDAAADGRPNDHEADGIRRGSALGRLEWRPCAPVMLYLGGRTEALNQEIDGLDPVTFDPLPDDDTGNATVRRHRGSVGGTLELPRGRVAVDAARTVTDRTTVDPTFVGKFKGIEDFAAVHVTGDALTPEATRTAFDQLSITVGSDFTRDHVFTVGTDLTGFSTPATNGIDESDHLNGIYGQLLAGGRYFEVSQSVRRDIHSREGGASTWRSGAAAFLAEGQVKLHGSVGKAFRAPTISDQFDPFSGNPNIQPVRSLGMDLGHVTRLPGNVAVENTWFRTVYEQNIGFGFDPATFTFPTINTDGYRVQGVESALTVGEGAPGLRLRASWTNQSTDLDETEIRSGRGFTFLPHNKVAIEPSFHHDRGWIAVRVDAVGRRIASSSSIRPEMAGYALVSASAGTTVAPGWEVYARGENLGDTAYELNPGFATSPIAGYVGVTGAF